MPWPEVRSPGAILRTQRSASTWVYGCGPSVHAVTISSFIISMYAGMSAMSKGRITNLSVLMEMDGKVVVMRSSMQKTG
ncbi:hypothetical protein Smic_11800 [Streptomyces microflavus]|uniref:Uncharacterized protein n=1 Tax=Streptomyces microflavus TaxID=1919 RepID=A0A7J0CL08_STRMI|nr:hypothetical protein Smic_11800 [Streptomyces microflavus]